MSLGASLAPERAPEVDRAAVARQVGKAKTSFYMAMRLLPKQRRDAMFAIYAFCRAVDDIVDGSDSEPAKRRALEQWRHEIEAVCAGGTSRDPVAQALAQPIHRFALRREDFMAVIDGMEMDAGIPIRAPDLHTLDLYCDRVAAAVGRLSVRAFGPLEANSDAVADALGRALQLTNILRDIDEDAAMGRLYLPREALEKHGIPTTSPTLAANHPGIDAACREVAALADTHFAAADRAIERCSGRTMRPAVMMRAVYRRYLDAMLVRGWTSPRSPIRLSAAAKLWIAVRSWLS